MNIFVLDRDPEMAAISQCDKHVPKMLLETAQIMSTALNALDPDLPVPYRPTHRHHPCTLWAHESYENFVWLAFHGIALVDEYRFRFKRTHASAKAVYACVDMSHQVQFPDIVGMTPHVQAMPEQYHHPDPIWAYRSYYWGAKRRFARWQRGRNEPTWFTLLDEERETHADLA
jgi:hypothetical protein